MSKGSPVIRVRVPAALLAQIEAAVERSQDTRSEGGYTLSSWIVAALRERLAKHQRSAASGRRRKKGGEDGIESNECPSGPGGGTTGPDHYP